MKKNLETLIEDARQLPLPQQLTLIERLARGIHLDLQRDRTLHDELAAWDDLSDEALASFEKVL
jgi:hypothetical protein